MSRVSSRPFIHVVCAALIDEGERILIAQRPAGKHLAGGWEFPGGKLERDELRRAALFRELQEELGVSIRRPRPLLRVRHAYSQRDVLLDMWVVKAYDGAPRGVDGQALRWCTQDELEATELLPADRPIVRALRLPERLTQSSTAHYTLDQSPGARLHGSYCSDWLQATAAARNGADFLVFTKELPNSRLARLCDSIDQPVFARGIELEKAWHLGASGISDIPGPFC